MEELLLNIASTAGTLLLGAVLGVCAERGFMLLKTLRPIKVEASVSNALPAWRVTNDKPTDDAIRDGSFGRKVYEDDPFCGFARFLVDITNTTDYVISIDDILIERNELMEHYAARVRYIRQGVSRPARLNCLLDGPKPLITDRSLAHARYGSGFFEDGSKIKVAPGDTERIIIVFAAVEHAWRFNFSLKYTIRNSSRECASILKNEAKLVPYKPSDLERDYCPRIMLSASEIDSEFEDALFFTDEMRDGELGVRKREYSSALEYIASLME